MGKKSVIGVFWFDIACRASDIGGLDFSTGNCLQAIHQTVNIRATGRDPKTGAHHTRKIHWQATDQALARLLRILIRDA
jgi:hypothetical protein